MSVGPLTFLLSSLGRASFPAREASWFSLVDVVRDSPVCSGQTAIAIAAAAPNASTSPTMAATRLIIGRVAERADQPRRDHDDDQQRDDIEGYRPDVAVGPQAQPAVDDHIDRHGGEEPAEDQADDQQRVPEIRIQIDSNSIDGQSRRWLAASPRQKHGSGHGQTKEKPADVR